MPAPRTIAATLAAILCATTAMADFGPVASPGGAQSPAPAATPQPSAPPLVQSTPASTPAPTPVAAGTPVPAATATPAPISYAPPQVSLTGKAIPGTRGISANGFHNGNSSSPYSLAGTLHSFHPPPDGYVIQCFFLVKSPDSKPLIYATATATATGEYSNINCSAPFDSEGHGFYAIPDDHYNFAPTSPGSPGSTKVGEVTRVKFPANIEPPLYLPVYGWIVRILVGDRVVYTDASQVDVALSVRNNKDFYDKIFAIYNSRPF